MKLINILLTITIFNSCLSNEKTSEDQLRICVNESLNESGFGDEIIYREPKIDYYEIMLGLESLYLKENIIKDLSKESYRNILSQEVDLEKGKKSSKIFGFL